MIAIRKLNKIWYSQQNVHNSVSFSSYVAWVLQLAEISYTNTQQVLLVVYRNFKAEMWHDIKMLILQTTKKEFIQQMKNQCHNWKEIFNQYKSVNSWVKSQQAYVNFSYLIFFRYVLSSFQSQRNWSSQRYNNYWKNKTKSSN